MSVLFCDLVGFTAASETADPEDVRARLVPYHAMLRERIEGFGGTVEKFVGDAVMAVFGAPVAHEDDAERAVRAGLAILTALEGLNAAAGMGLSVRVGINTGEVVVALDARPELGEGFVTGDVVNTAARIQTAAPVGAVAVGESTYQATSRVFAYEPLDPVAVKGKTDPVALWRAGAPRARLGADVIRASTTPLVGRELELLQLRTVFDRVTRDAAVHLVTIAGEPGVGKSRLVAELFSYIDDLPELITWRTGRCLPYGDGVTFWALGEIVKSHAGILDTDDTDVATAKLDAVLPDSEDASWLRARLLPLIGVTTESGGSGQSQEESFTAWRRFLESFASTGPAVLLVEDIHWADTALLQFLEHMVSWAHGVPLLVVCTARPELFDHHPTWGAGLRNSTTLNLNSLSAAETADVVSHLLGLRLLPAETQQLILDRAEGNPLWAEECVRVLRDRDLIDAQGRLRTDQVPLPQGVQALIAARLDTLSPAYKAMLADAAVVGRVFWADAVVAMGERDPTDVSNALHELTAKELVRPQREATLAGQAEYAFWHGLVRDVAYQTLPRSSRAAKHLAASNWLEAQAGDRVVDVAEILAEHTGHALELAEAASDSRLVQQVKPAARRHAMLAAQKALQLDSARAMVLLERALALTPAEDAGYPDVLFTWAKAAMQLGQLREAATASEEAATRYLHRDDVLSAGDALRFAAMNLLNVGDPGSRGTLDRALHLLEREAPSAELGQALMVHAFNQTETGSSDDALTTVARVESLLPDGDLELLGTIHMVKGMARCRLGDFTGLDDLRRSIQYLIDGGHAHSAAIGYANLADTSAPIAGPAATLDQLDAGEAFCESRGLAGANSYLRAIRVRCLGDVGRFDEALELANELLPAFEDAQDDLSFVEVALMKALILLERGESAEGLAEQVLRAARRTEVAPMISNALLVAAAERLSADEAESVAALLREALGFSEAEKLPPYASWVHGLVKCAIGIGDIELARQFVETAQAAAAVVPAQQHAIVTARARVCHAGGDCDSAVQLFTDAAERWAAFGNRVEQAHALLELGESLQAQGRDAEETLSQARELFASMGAVPGVRRCHELLAEPHGTEHNSRAG